ncbi:hypothetical protein [Streptomyces endophyticus]|uniref:Uncharacterized protein n=1 Tax=Streptomyces endophyticus TaxID=714166 RepID=A0ABU6FDR2_9ACTN|nr:hypothetical protein [Streptomyces endophyticus]MEB8342104.1 hypothetical protein [Streptomyces endophyticus]
MSARVRDVVRDVVAEVAPDEVLLLDKLANLDEGRVTRLFARTVEDGEPYECGHVDVTAPVTPVVWLALDEAARSTTCRTADRRTARRKPLLRHLFRRPARPAPELRCLSAAQLDAVRHLVHAHAHSARLGEDAAQALADSVVSRLALELTDAS